MSVAEQYRPVGAHQVDVLAPVDVPDAGGLATGEELRITVAQASRAQVAVHPVGDDLASPLAISRIDRAGEHGSTAGIGGLRGDVRSPVPSAWLRRRQCPVAAPC